jgi:hypothetical protein
LPIFFLFKFILAKRWVFFWPLFVNISLEDLWIIKDMLKKRY